MMKYNNEINSKGAEQHVNNLKIINKQLIKTKVYKFTGYKKDN